ncbi:serine hydrolase domain-containing protein [Nakamurella sp. GG22]
MIRDAVIRDAVVRHVEEGDPPGAVWAVVDADGSVADHAGTAGPGGGDIDVHTVFRLSSTTKPIVAALAMTLVDDGTLALDDSIDDLLPELADRRVMIDAAGSVTDTVPARRSITVRDVFEFRLGMGMDFSAPWPSPLMAAAAEAGLPMGPPAPQQNPAPTSGCAGSAPSRWRTSRVSAGCITRAPVCWVFWPRGPQAGRCPNCSRIAC